MTSDGRMLTLGLVAALALAGAVRRRGSPMRADQHTLHAAQLHAKIDQIEAMRGPQDIPAGLPHVLRGGPAGPSGYRIATKGPDAWRALRRAWTRFLGRDYWDLPDARRIQDFDGIEDFHAYQQNIGWGPFKARYVETLRANLPRSPR